MLSSLRCASGSYSLCRVRHSLNAYNLRLLLAEVNLFSSCITGLFVCRLDLSRMKSCEVWSQNGEHGSQQHAKQCLRQIANSQNSALASISLYHYSSCSAQPPVDAGHPVAPSYREYSLCWRTMCAAPTYKRHIFDT